MKKKTEKVHMVSLAKMDTRLIEIQGQSTLFFDLTFVSTNAPGKSPQTSPCFRLTLGQLHALKSLLEVQAERAVQKTTPPPGSAH